MTLADGSPLAGARISLESPSLQSPRSTEAAATGRYLVALLPPGEYEVSISAESATPLVRRLRLPAGSHLRLDAALEPVQVFESLTVRASGPTYVRSEITGAFDIAAESIASTPIDRSARGMAELAPGVLDNGPISNLGSSNERPGLMLSGAASYDSLFLVDGVDVGENLRGQPLDLFVEEAIEAVRVETSRIPAEYGSFSGGVVHVVTRSGSNRNAGTVRLSLASDRWIASRRLEDEIGIDTGSNEIVPLWEATLGGSLRRDRLWYFGAGRWSSVATRRTTHFQPLPGDLEPTPMHYTQETKERRLGLNLSAALSPRHRWMASLLDFTLQESRSTFNPIILDTRMLVPVDYPSDLATLRYEGLFSDDLFAEAQHSRRRSAVEQGGKQLTDRIDGTWLLDSARSGARYHSPVFRPGTQRYDNDSWLAKVSWFASNERFGTHDLRIGGERTTSTTRGAYPFSGSDYDVRLGRTIVRGTEVFPVIEPGTILEYSPVLEPNHGIRLTTTSLFLHDRATLGRRWSLSLGLRYDRQDDALGNGLKLPRADAWSPRTALAFDPFGDGRLSVVAGYALYAARTPDSLAVFALPGGGQAARFAWVYTGPCVNCDVAAPTELLVPTEEALRLLFAWFDATGGISSRPTVAAQIPGFTVRVRDGLVPPRVVERSLGVAARLGSKGAVQIDFVDREWQDAYGTRIDRTTGRTEPDPYFGRTYDLAVLENSSALRRTYRAAHSHLNYRLGATATVNASYTWARLEGNFTPEVRCCAASPATLREYPEYSQERWNHPLGPLSSFGRPGWPAVDQRHRARFWLTAERRLRGSRISAALVQSIDSGRPYEAVGFIDPRPWVVNPGYATPPARVAYFFSRPAAFRTPTLTATDIALTWTVSGPRDLEFVVQPEVLNLFDEQGVVRVDTTVHTAANDRSLRPFDPFHETPRAGLHYRLGPDFGRPLSAADRQSPRTFRLRLGVRF